MSELILNSTKYAMIILFAVFTYISFRVQRYSHRERKVTLLFQRMIILLFHALGFYNIIVHVYRGDAGNVSVQKAVLLYGGELIYLIFMCFILHMILDISPGFNNVMCMMITLGFIFQTRLSFATGSRHFLLTVAATVIFILALIIVKRLDKLYDLTWVYAIAGIVLLAAVLIFAEVSGGAKTSIDLKYFYIQPFEFVKILFVLFTAAAFNKANSFKTVLITAVTAAAYILILVMCNELGTALMLAVVYVLMLYVATKKVVYLIISLIAFAAASIVTYMMFAHARIRIDVWLDPWTDIDNKGYQITQSLFAIGTGGWLGSGLYNGSPESIPMVSNDFIFSAISEELGAVFAIFLIILCLCFMLMIYRIAIRVSRPFYKLSAFGIGTVYGFQVFLTIAGAIKMIPSTGINLPFISRGGSSILACMIMVAIVQVIYIKSEMDAARTKEIAALRQDDEYTGPDSLKDEKITQVKSNEIDMY